MAQELDLTPVKESHEETPLGLLSEVLQPATPPKKQQQQQQQGWFRRGSVPPSPPPAIAVAKGLGTAAESKRFTLGCLALCALVFVCGASPELLPNVFLIFSAVALPWRVVTFVRRKWTPFLVDFCYFANLAAIYLLLVDPGNLRLGALVYILTEGPLAAALVAWQSTWLLGSADHTVSVLIHLLPGLALFAHRFLQPGSVTATCALFSSPRATLLVGKGPSVSSAAAAAAAAAAPAADVGAADATCAAHADVDQPVLWLVVAPLLFYCAWQLIYWLLVQVLFRQAILRSGHDTSYNALARRAAAANSMLNVWVRRGSIARRVTMYGLIQLAFTVVTALLAVPTYYSFSLAAAWQVVKFAVPLYYGAQYQCRKVPAKAFLVGIEQLAAQGLVSRDKLLGPTKLPQ